MKITVRGRSLPSLAVLLIVCLAPQLFGADPTYVQSAKSEVEPKTVFHLDPPKSLGVIIELHAAPLLESRRNQDVRLASESLDALASQLEKDLARIEGTAAVQALSEGGGAIRHTYKMVFAGASATVSRASLKAIRALPYVRAVHEDRKVEAYLARSLPHLGVPQIWGQHGRRGKGIVVAVIDTGIDYQHWAFGEGFGPGFKVAGGYDIFNNDADPMDDHGHGTHVAGIIAANHKNLTGVAPEATLLAYKVLDQSGGSLQSIVLAGVERAIDPNRDGDLSDRPDVVNMSLGGPASPDDPVIAAVERGAAAGIVFCLAAGNSGVVGGLGSPALAPSAITVAASDLNDKVAAFSTGGPVGGVWSLKPEISAPGVGIVSAYLDDGLRSASGTSMASPHVAGVAALLLEEHPDWTPLDVKVALVSTAKPIVGRDHESGRFMTYSGGGRIDPVRAIGATILPSQPAASFGMVRTSGQPWTAPATVSLTNRGTSAETLTLQPPQLPAGAKLTVVPESVTLAAGASAELRLTLEVTGNAVPNDSDVLLAGILELTGTSSSMQLPWTILKADVIQVTYTGDEEFQIYLSNGSRQAAMWPAGPRTYAALIPLMLTSDIMIVTPATEDRDARLILRERQPVEGFTEVTLTPDDAPYKVVIDGVDERGIPLNQVEPGNPGRLWHRFELPSHPLIEITRNDGGRSLWVSSFKEITFRTYETVLAGPDYYFAAYRQLKKMKQAETLVLRPADWASQKIRALCRKPGCTVSAGAGLGSPQFYTYHELPEGTSEVKLHITPGTDPRYDFRAYVFAREKGTVFDPNVFVNPWTFFSNSLRNVNGRFSTSPFGRVSGAEYYPPDREEALVLGDGPPVFRTAAGAWWTIVEPYGPAGEYFGDDEARDVNVNIERLDGPVTIHQFANSQYGMPRPTPGIYRLTVTDDYSVSGHRGRLTQLSNYDTRANPDGPPTLSALRIENGRGTATTTVMAGSPSRVAFAVRQSVMTDQTDWEVRHSRPDIGATQAWWRPHGAAEWLPLRVTNTGEDYSHKGEFPGSPGTLYTAALAPATAAEGKVDLKFFLKNTFGGTTEVVYEPAFIVGPSGTRRRSMR